MLVALTTVLALGSLVGTKVSDKLVLDHGFPPEKVTLAERIKDKKVPGYLENVDALKAVGINEVIIYCVNDGAVMDAWAKDQGVEGSDFITMMGDPSGSVTNALDMVLDHPGPMGVLGYKRCKRFAMYIDNGTIKLVKVSEAGPMGEEDPAGDAYPEGTLAPAMVDAIKTLNEKSEL